MVVKAKILATERFSIDGKAYVKLQGFLSNKGLFQQTVKEELIPDILEGRECNLEFDIGLDGKLKPYLRLKSISLLEA